MSHKKLNIFGVEAWEFLLYSVYDWMKPILQCLRAGVQRGACLLHEGSVDFVSVLYQLIQFTVQ